MDRYREILRTARVARLFAASLLARLPLGINGLAIVLLVQAETGSFGPAGAASGALALGSGLCAPLAARTIDALGPRMLLLLAAVHAAAVLGVVGLTRADAGTAAVVLAAFVAGGAFPPTSSVLRAQYPILFADRPSLLQTAFALDSVLTETVFTVAPLLTAALVVLFEPAAAMVVSAVAVLAGTVAMLGALPRAAPRDPDVARTAGLGALAAPGIRTLVASMLPVGFGLGALEVALPAYADHEGSPELAGVLVGLWAFGSAAGGLAYGARPRRAPLTHVHLRVAVLLPLTFLPLLLASSPVTMALLVIPAGLCIAPMIATRNELAGAVAPVGSETEAYTWPLTALVAGIALGAAASGALADEAGWQTAVLAAVLAAGTGALVSASRRSTLACAAS